MHLQQVPGAQGNVGDVGMVGAEVWHFGRRIVRKGGGEFSIQSVERRGVVCGSGGKGFEGFRHVRSSCF